MGRKKHVVQRRIHFDIRKAISALYQGGIVIESDHAKDGEIICRLIVEEGTAETAILVSEIVKSVFFQFMNKPGSGIDHIPVFLNYRTRVEIADLHEAVRGFTHLNLSRQPLLVSRWGDHRQDQHRA